MDPNPLVETLLAQAAEAAARARLPESTYRLQFHAGFTFRDATAIVPYLRDLGITHCYASPYLKARPGSTHGYDIIDHGCLNPEIGTEEDYEAWVAALRDARAWARSSTPCPTTWASAPTRTPGGTTCWRTARPRATAPTSTSPGTSSPRPELQDKVLLPVLGDPYGDVLEAGQLELAFADGAFSIHYFDRRFPVAPRSYARILAHRLDELERALGPEDPALLEYQSILTAVRNLPRARRPSPTRSPSASARRRSSSAGWRRWPPRASRCASSSSGTWPRSTASRATRAASTCSTTCWSGSAIAWPTGGWPPTRSTTGASSTSTTWPP